VLVVTLLLLTFMGDAMRDALDPRKADQIPNAGSRKADQVPSADPRKVAP